MMECTPAESTPPTLPRFLRRHRLHHNDNNHATTTTAATDNSTSNSNSNAIICHTEEQPIVQGGHSTCITVHSDLGASSPVSYTNTAAVLSNESDQPCVSSGESCVTAGEHPCLTSGHACAEFIGQDPDGGGGGGGGETVGPYSSGAAESGGSNPGGGGGGGPAGGDEASLAAGAGAGSEKRNSRHSQASTSSASSESSGSKRARRLAKKVPSMSPGAKWRRLRNTLKAANEMQAPKKKHALSREDSFLRKFSTRNQRLHSQVLQDNNDGGYPSGPTGGAARNHAPRSFKPPRNLAVQHDGSFMFNWLGVVTVAVLYNLWTCILRQAFHEVQDSCHACWFTFDALCDVVYLLDILVQFRTGYLDQGLMVYDSKKLAVRYIRSKLLYVDALCLMPLDFLQFYIGVHPMIRFPRFFKVYRTFRFLHMLESRTAYPNLIRVANLTHILFLGAHWFAAFYYMISEAEDFQGKWSYPKPVGPYAFISRKYLASLFWSTLTLTTIGDLPPPDDSKDWGMSNAAYVFVILSYLIGVFVFATIVGQVGNVINNKNASRQEFERLLDGAKVYMQTHNVPSDLQKRVQRWYDYVWSRGRLNGCDINSLGLLPDKLKTELAIHVNLETLKKVTIFQECQPEFLHDLVLKMKAYIFTPGDLICRRGEVAREMFIIADGVVEIISESGTVLKQMGAGDFFGEIGILNLDGGINRRTADVRSVGYSELFVLSRDDVLGALKDHPDAESIIRDYGQRRLREIEAHRQKVKPLKQMGHSDFSNTNPRRLLHMRTVAGNLPPASGNAGGNNGGGNLNQHNQNQQGVFATQARAGSGGRTYTYCYTNEDPESHLSFATSDKGFFHSVCSSLRRIFHRKVRRQKSLDETEGRQGRFAWMGQDDQGAGGEADGGRVVRLCCSTGAGAGGGPRQEEYIPVPTSAPDQLVPSRNLCGSPSGYTAVLTEEDEQSRSNSPMPSPMRQFFSNTDRATGEKDADTDAQNSESRAGNVTNGKTVAEVNHVMNGDAQDNEPLTPSQNPNDLRHADNRITEVDETGSCKSGSNTSTPCKDPKEISPSYRCVDSTSNVIEGSASAGTDGDKRDVIREGRRTRSEELDDSFFLVTLQSARDRSNSDGPLKSRHIASRLDAARRATSPPGCIQSAGDVARRVSQRPAIRVDSASTLDDSGDSDDAVDASSRASNLLHPGYRYAPSGAHDEDEDEDMTAEEAAHRCRSNSAPNIIAHALSGCSADLPPATVSSLSAARLSSAGSAVAVGAIAALPSAPRPTVSLFQRITLSSSAVLLVPLTGSPCLHQQCCKSSSIADEDRVILSKRLSSWAKLDGSKRHSLGSSSVSMERLDSAAPWTSATDPLMHVQLKSDDVTGNKEHMTSLLVQLQASHAQLLSRMSELEAAYVDNAQRLDRLGQTQADMLALLRDRLRPLPPQPQREPRRNGTSRNMQQGEVHTTAL